MRMRGLRTPTERSLLEGIPDQPVWVETRSMLLHDEAEISGFREQPLSAVLQHRSFPLVCIVGSPTTDAVFAAALAAGPGVEVLVPPGGNSSLEQEEGWTSEDAIIHVLDDVELARKREPNSAVRMLKDRDSLQHLNGRLRREIRVARAFTQVAAGFQDGLPVSFGYAGARTETFWDVSIETLPEFRRRGLASEVMLFLVRKMNEKRLKPVWGALESNTASRSMAERLGFRPVSRVRLFTVGDPDWPV